VNYYVDGALTGSGNGTSWASAWNAFSKISWGSIKPGDTIYISGGASSQVHRETLTVGASGSSAGQVTISRGLDPGHNGQVIIDCENARWNGVWMNSRNNVTIDGLTIRNVTDAGIGVRYSTAGVLIRNNSVYSGDPGGGNARGYDVRGCTGPNAVIVRGNSFSTPISTNAQTDGIWSSDNDGVVFEGNRIVISNSSSYGHSDGIQSFQDKHIIVRNNLFDQSNTAKYNNHGAWLENTRTDGVIEFYNSIVSAPNLTGDAAVAHYMRSGWTEAGTIRIFGNTIVGGDRPLYLDNSPRAQVYNNIIVGSPGHHAVVILNAPPPAANIDNNLLWAPSGTVAYMSSGNLSWSQWRARGYDAHGVSTDPMFTNAPAKDFSLSANSPAINAGRTIPELATDYNGMLRPAGAYDIGALERQGSATPSTLDTLTLTMAEDAWKGDAQFTVAVNGQLLGPPQTVTAQQWIGQTQNFTFTGNWGSGPADLAISFINDAWGGTSATDRNLWVLSATYNGRSRTLNVHITSNETRHFVI
jgi:hypothetical protein